MKKYFSISKIKSQMGPCGALPALLYLYHMCRKDSSRPRSSQGSLARKSEPCRKELVKTGRLAPERVALLS